jgi:hypothetical protein
MRMRSASKRIWIIELLIICIALTFVNNGWCERGERAAPLSSFPSFEGDPMLFTGWAPDTIVLYRGGTGTTVVIWPGNSPSGYLPEGPKGPDTLCFDLTGIGPLTWTCNPPFGTPRVAKPGSSWYQRVYLAASPSVPGSIYYVVGTVAYSDASNQCRPDAGDVNNPNIRPSDGRLFYSYDTLVVLVQSVAPSVQIVRDTFVVIERGMQQAYVPFDIFIPDASAAPREFAYRVTSRGRIGPALDQTGAAMVGGGPGVRMYSVLDASVSPICDFDTLTIRVWSTGAPFVGDTVDQVVHVLEPVSAPIFKLPVVAILTLALILIAALFLRKQALART